MCLRSKYGPMLKSNDELKMSCFWLSKSTKNVSPTVYLLKTWACAQKRLAMAPCSKETTTPTCRVSVSQITTRKDYEQKIYAVCLRACCFLNPLNISPGVLFSQIQLQAQHAEVQKGRECPGCLASVSQCSNSKCSPSCPVSGS